MKYKLYNFTFGFVYAILISLLTISKPLGIGQLLAAIGMILGAVILYKYGGFYNLFIEKN